MLSFLIALLPILLILLLMLGLRWGAVQASLAGYLAALGIAIFYFGGGLQLLAYAHLKALLSTLDVLLIIWAAFLFYRVTDEAGVITQLGDALPHLTADRGMQALVVGWGFASFLQGVGGFGVPVAVVAPLLLGLGFPPMAAILIPSVGSGWAVTFGSLGSSFQALIATTGLSAAELAVPSATFLGIAALFTGLLVMHIAEGWRGMLRLALPALLMGFVMGLVQLAVAAAGPWNTAAFIGSLAGLALSLGLARFYRGGPRVNPKLETRRLWVALSGYAILLLTILLVQMVPPIRQALGGVVLRVSLPALATRLGYLNPASLTKPISLLNHAGAVLLYASFLAFLVYQLAGRFHPGALKSILSGTAKRVLSPSLSILLMVCMAVVMEMTGMTQALAQGLAEITGRAFPPFAAWIGAIGAFMTGSNTNSNVVFSLLQLRTAKLLGYPVAIILAGQTAGAALASVAAPAKLVVGTSTAGQSGREGEVMRRMLPYILLLVLLISLITTLGMWTPQ